MKPELITKTCILTISGIAAGCVYINGLDKSIVKFYRVMTGLNEIV